MEDELAKDLEQLEEGSAVEEAVEQLESGSTDASEEASESVESVESTEVSETEEEKAGRLRYSSYTKKMQGLAKERQRLQEERERFESMKGLRDAELRELEDWRRIDRVISNDPKRLEQFKALWGGISQEQKSDNSASQIPTEIQSRIAELEAREEDRLLAQEMNDVRSLVGDISKSEESAFLSYVDKLQERVDGVIPLPDAAKMFFVDKLVEKTRKAKDNDLQKRSESKAKTKPVGKGKKAKSSVKDGAASDDAFLAEIERMMGV